MRETSYDIFGLPNKVAGTTGDERLAAEANEGDVKEERVPGVSRDQQLLEVLRSDGAGQLASC